MPSNPYRGDRFSKEIISACAWLYFNFALSLRDMEVRMASRNVFVSSEMTCNWCDKLSSSSTAQLKRT